jgi:hypothetical protein
MAIRPELARRHPESLAKLLAEVVFGIKPAPPRDLRHAKIAGLEEAGSLFEAFFLEEVAQEPAGNAMKSTGNILSGVSEFLRDGLNADVLILTDPASDTLD